MSRKPKAAQGARDKFDLLHAVMADADLSASAKCVYVVLLLRFRNSKSGRCNPSLATIGKAIGRQRRAVVSAVAELRESGWLKTVSTKGGSKLNTNKFVFDLKQRRPVSYTTPVQQTTPVSYTVRTSVVDCPRILEEPPALSARGCVGEMPASAPAPDGAALEKKSTALAESFGTLCCLWKCKPDILDEPKALKAFRRVCDEHPAEDILDGAVRWVAATKPRYLPKLQVWLSNGAWQKEPPDRSAERTGRRGKEDPAEAMARAGGWEFE